MIFKDCALTGAFLKVRTINVRWVSIYRRKTVHVFSSKRGHLFMKNLFFFLGLAFQIQVNFHVEWTDSKSCFLRNRSSFDTWNACSSPLVPSLSRFSGGKRKDLIDRDLLWSPGEEKFLKNVSLIESTVMASILNSKSYYFWRRFGVCFRFENARGSAISMRCATPKENIHRMFTKWRTFWVFCWQYSLFGTLGLSVSHWKKTAYFLLFMPILDLSTWACPSLDFEINLTPLFQRSTVGESGPL